MLGTLYVKSELEVGGKYADILLVPKEEIRERYSILIEFKYIKQEDYDRDNEILQQKQDKSFLINNYLVLFFTVIKLH